MKTNPPVNTLTAQQAAGWLMRINSAACTDQEHKEWDAWLSSAPGHRAEYEQMERVWSALDDLQTAPFPELKQAEQDWQNAADDPNPVGQACRLPGFSTPQPQKTASDTLALQARISSRSIPLALAASVLFALILGWLWQGLHIEWIDYRTTQGEQKMITLADGSQVIMNTATRLTAGQSAWYRKIKLRQGEALFKVAHDPARPFEVTAEQGIIRALGTQFNVYRKPDRVSVSVLEGKVRISTENSGRPSSVELVAGYGVDYRSNNALLRPEKIAIDRMSVWREQRLLFDRTPLSEAVHELNRYRSSAILIGNPRLNHLTVSGAFNTHDSAAFLRAIQKILPVKAKTLTDGSVTLTSTTRP